MTDGGGRHPGVSFPMKVHTDDEDFVIELDETSMASPPDEYGLDGDRVRCKRRKRCGQCGPCQVKENCNKCHFCIRKDVLKQTCIYRKCIYLRSKPKPYTRPRENEPMPGMAVSGRGSPQHTISSSIRSPPANIRSPMQSPHVNLRTPPGGNMQYKDQPMSGAEVHPENPFLPPHMPQAPITSNTFSSQQNHMMDRGQSLPHTHPAAVNLNMHMNMTPHGAVTPDMSTSPPVQKMGEATPPVVNSPPCAIPGLPPPPVPPHVTNSVNIQPFIPPISNSAIHGMQPVSVPSMPGITDRPSFTDFRHPDQVPISHHPHPHYPSVHPHASSLPMTHRETNMFADHSRVPPHMNFNMNAAGHIDNLSRGTNDSSCMYHPGLPPYSMPGSGPFPQPSGPAYFGGAPTHDMFRSNFLNSFPPGYSYPTNRYSDGFHAMPFSGLGMGSPSPFPQYPGQGAGMGMSSAFSQQYSPYNSQHGCPKNGSCPPVSPSIDNDDVKVIQEGYKLEKSNSTSSVNSAISRSPSQDMSQMSTSSMPSAVSSHSKVEFHDVKAVQEGYRNMERSDSFSSWGSRSSFWEPWKSPSLYSPRHDDVRSRLSVSTMSSDFEADVISVDDYELNALIRSNGCNRIEIEFDKRSANEESSPRKGVAMSDNDSPTRNIGFRPINFSNKLSRGRELFSPLNTTDMEKESRHNTGFTREVEDVEINRETNNNIVESSSRKHQLLDARNSTQDVRKRPIPTHTVSRPGKKYFKGSVCVKQDLGDEGTIQLELPGCKVSIEDTILDEDMSKSSSNLKELLDFIDGRQKFENLNVQSKEAISLK